MPTSRTRVTQGCDLDHIGSFDGSQTTFAGSGQYRTGAPASEALTADFDSFMGIMHGRARHSHLPLPANGTHARWVKRFLPSTANRVVFVVILVAVTVALIVQGAGGVTQEDRGGYFDLTFAVLCGAALHRFVYEWWLRSQVQHPPAPRNDRG